MEKTSKEDKKGKIKFQKDYRFKDLFRKHMHALKIEKTKANLANKLLVEMQILENQRKVTKEEDFVIFPLKREPDIIELQKMSKIGGEVIEIEVSERRLPPEPYDVVIELAKKRNFTEKVQKKLPRKWDRLGDIILLKFSNRVTNETKELEGYKKEIGKVYADALSAKSVVIEYGVYGKMRKPNVELIYGDSTETVHVENGIKYKLDVSKIMFSSGNTDERVRMSRINCKDEYVVDMFAGIGYFTLPIAKYTGARKVVAIELNPESYNYLVENVKINGVENIVEPHLGDNLVVSPLECADRIMMGYIHGTINYFAKALNIIKKSGGIIHFHDTVPTEEPLAKEVIDRIKKESARNAFSVTVNRLHEVKSYAPGISHVVIDLAVKRIT